MFCLEYAGFHPVTKEASFDVRLPGGGFAGVITPRKDGTYRVWFNSEATRGSARKFVSIAAAVEYIRARRVKKGWRV